MVWEGEEVRRWLGYVAAGGVSLIIVLFIITQIIDAIQSGGKTPDLTAKLLITTVPTAVGILIGAMAKDWFDDTEDKPKKRSRRK